MKNCNASSFPVLIIGEGLALRPMALSDAEFIFEANTIAIQRTFMSFSSLKGVEAWVADTLRCIARGEKAEFVLECQTKGKIGLIGINEMQTVPDIGICIREGEQRKGYAKKALMSLISWLWTQSNSRRVCYRTEEKNYASIALAKSLGFKPINGTSTDTNSIHLELFSD
jgi:RimJ/RimL family protein N-acetyltransferase